MLFNLISGNEQMPRKVRREALCQRRTKISFMVSNPLHGNRLLAGTFECSDADFVFFSDCASVAGVGIKMFDKWRRLAPYKRIEYVEFVLRRNGNVANATRNEFELQIYWMNKVIYESHCTSLRPTHSHDDINDGSTSTIHVSKLITIILEQ